MWVQVEGTTDRWNWVYEWDPWRHQLLHGNGMLAELHGQFLHKYDDQDNPVDPEWPLNNAWPYSSERLADPVDSDEEGWQILEATVAEGLV